jgi:phosphate transport system protein
MARAHYDQQLRELEDDLLRMASMVESAVGRAVAALQAQDVDAARQIIAEDDTIDRAQYAVEDKALSLIALQAPIATDLRLISAVISVASELERMGDYAEGIAEITIRGAREPLLKPLVDIPRMAQLAQRMIRHALDSFVNRDLASARTLHTMDDEIDTLTTKVQNELLQIMQLDSRQTERAMQLMFVAHNLERLGDRATNIGERMIFLVTGQLEDLND